jgi:hypothetical protein
MFFVVLDEFTYSNCLQCKKYRSFDNRTRLVDIYLSLLNDFGVVQKIS